MTNRTASAVSVLLALNEVSAIPRYELNKYRDEPNHDEPEEENKSNRTVSTLSVTRTETLRSYERRTLLCQSFFSFWNSSVHVWKLNGSVFEVSVARTETKTRLSCLLRSRSMLVGKTFRL